MYQLTGLALVILVHLGDGVEKPLMTLQYPSSKWHWQRFAMVNSLLFVIIRAGVWPKGEYWRRMPAIGGMWRQTATAVVRTSAASVTPLAVPIAAGVIVGYGVKKLIDWVWWIRWSTIWLFSWMGAVAPLFFCFLKWLTRHHSFLMRNRIHIKRQRCDFVHHV